ncbi:MAG: alpha/beta hydrolase [Brevundimonas sp.]|nr:alpha/beta hydrolase [Brevundimonas sp.]
MRAWIAGVVMAAAMAGTATAQEVSVETYRTVGDRALAAHVFPAAPSDAPRAAALIFHGGGWVAGQPEWTYGAARILTGQGLRAIPIQYRLSGDGVTPADALSDACAAFAWVRENAGRLGVDPERVAGYGVSAGGHLVAAAGLGACPDGAKGPDLMLLWSPAVDLANDGWVRRLLGGADPAPISPLSLADRGGPPTAIVQGEEDTLTRTVGARAFCDALKAAGGVCDLHLYPGLGHLLTRNLANQESDFDIDPVADRDGDAKLNAFLAAHGYTAAH